MPEDAFTFSPATADQRDAVERLLRSAFIPYVRKLGRELAPDAYAWLAPSLARGDVFVGCEGGSMVGVVATTWQGRELVIDQVAVRPERQGAGVGSCLLERIEAHARDLGAEALTLHTAEMMMDLLRLYSRQGFAEVRRARPTHGKDAHFRVYLRKDL